MMRFGILVVVVAGVCAGICIASCVYLGLLHRQRSMQRVAALRNASQREGNVEAAWLSAKFENGCMQGMRELTMRLSVGAATAIAPSVRARSASSTRLGRFFETHARAAGCEGRIGAEAFCETCVRYALMGTLSGALLGVFMSNELAVLLGLVGAGTGFALPGRVLVREETLRGLDASRHLSEMLEVVALGLRSGLTFDRSFALYGRHFDSGFAKACGSAHRRWSLGLSTREEALRLLADSYACDQLAHIVESVIRSLKLGSSLVGPLEEFAEQARLTYRTALEERVAKAPVKMMLPTGTLILPAMLLLVMGPILLELTQGF